VSCTCTLAVDAAAARSLAALCAATTSLSPASDARGLPLKKACCSACRALQWLACGRASVHSSRCLNALLQLCCAAAWLLPGAQPNVRQRAPSYDYTASPRARHAAAVTRAPASPDTSGAGAAHSCLQAQRWQGAVTATLAAARARAAWPLPACHSGAGGQHLARHPTCDCCCLVCSVVCTCAAVRAARPGWHAAAVGGKGGQGIQCMIKLIVWLSCLLLCMFGGNGGASVITS
jgi:hypothetical protein